MSSSHRINRRTVLGATAAAAGSTLWPAGVGAQGAWPNRPLRIIDPSSAGGSTDVMGRMLASKLGPRIGQSIVVENKPGAGLAIGVDTVAKSPADGYTMLINSTAVAVSVASGRKLPFDFLKELTPVGQFASTPLIIVVPAESPIKTLRDLVEQGRARPDSIRYSSSGIGSMSHIGMELLGAQTQARLTHVPYRGVSLAIPDLLSGQVQAALGTVATYSALLESGKLRALVQTAPRRSPFIPSVPTSAEAGFPNYLIEFTFGLMMRRGTPATIVKRLNAELNAVAAQPETRELLARFAAVPTFGTPDDYGRTNAADIARWSKLIKDAGIKVE